MSDPKTAEQINAPSKGIGWSTEAELAKTIADKVRFLPSMVCACGKMGCYDLTTQFLCRECWEKQSARLQQPYAPQGMLIVDSDLYAQACEKMLRLERERADLLKDKARLVTGERQFLRLASYAATVRLDRRKVVDGTVMCLQTEDWCKGLLEYVQSAIAET